MAKKVYGEKEYVADLTNAVSEKRTFLIRSKDEKKYLAINQKDWSRMWVDGKEDVKGVYYMRRFDEYIWGSAAFVARELDADIVDEKTDLVVERP